MGVFDNCSVLLELKHLSFKEKKKLKASVTDNGGSITFVINKQCSLVVTSDVSNLSSNRLRSIQKHRTPVVEPDYLHRCVETGVLLPVDGYQLDPSSAPPPSPRQAPPKQQAPPPNGRVFPEPAGESGQEKFRIYSQSDPDLPAFPDDFQVAKYSVFKQTSSRTWCVLELQSVRTEPGRRYRVVRYWKDDVTAEEAAVMDQLVFLSSSEEALDVYEALMDQLDSSGMEKVTGVFPEVQHLGSTPLQQLLLEEKLSSGSLTQDVAVFVELLWTEALGCLSKVLRVPIDKLSLNDVSRAEGFLLQAQKKLKEENVGEALSLLDEVFVLLPHWEARPWAPTQKFLSQKLDLCQLIRDVLNVSEVTLRSPAPSSVGKYRSLRCSIEAVPPSSAEFQNVSGLLKDSPIQVHQVLRVSRGVELQTFNAGLGNVKPLLHSSSPSNFVGILSRGLLLPHVAVEHHGIERTDFGNLGCGIYFSDSMSTSLKYSKPGSTDQSRLLLVCDVALGRCKEVRKRDPTLDRAPEGHHSVHGVRRTNSSKSDFEDDEFVVYSPDQVKIKYVVQFSVEGDQLKDFQPAVTMLAEPSPPETGRELPLQDEDMDNMKNPLEDVKAGLLDGSGQQLPLQAVHVRCKLMDLLSQVIIFQTYTNLSSVPIEAKYVFPLDEFAAVCGFEAFINGKHVVGQVKEKKAARREYKQAIERGHGAYLMDQDAPDVFTISVGNLPPGATVLIKVTFVSELVVKDGNVLFSLPGSVAPWQESAALNQTTQVSVQKVCVTDDAAGKREFTLELSVEMPYEMSSLVCTTHQVQMKKTDCKAVVRVLPDQVLGPDGFQLSITLPEAHLPRMWVEKHPDKDSQACMLVFYPDFEPDFCSEADEVVLLLDTSESMKGESLRLAQQIALQVLRKLQTSTRVNVVLFGTDHTEALLRAQTLSEVHLTAESFIKSGSPPGGSTELWRPLQALSLLPPARGVRNLLLLSDGHIQNAALTLQLLRDHAQHSRLFTCGLSPTANRYMLRALAQAGGGAYEFFDTKTKHTWSKKVLHQVKRMSSPGCSSVSVKWQQFNPVAPPPVQAPKQLHALFSDCHTLVYGLVPHCTQATLLGNLDGQELKTMVSTTELQKTRGTFLHKLTARALIRDYEDGSLDSTEAGHEGKKVELESFIVELSKENSILSQFTSFVAIEERDSDQKEDGVTDVPKLVADEDVDFLPYVGWTGPQEEEEGDDGSASISSESAAMEDRADMDSFYEDMFCCFDSEPPAAAPLVRSSSVLHSSPMDVTFTYSMIQNQAGFGFAPRLAKKKILFGQAALRAAVEAPETPVRAAETPLRAAETPLRAAETPLRAAETPVRAAAFKMKAPGQPSSLFPSSSVDLREESPSESGPERLRSRRLERFQCLITEGTIRRKTVISQSSSSEEVQTLEPEKLLSGRQQGHKSHFSPPAFTPTFRDQRIPFGSSLSSGRPGLSSPAYVPRALPCDADAPPAFISSLPPPPPARYAPQHFLAGPPPPPLCTADALFIAAPSPPSSSPSLPPPPPARYAPQPFIAGPPPPPPPPPGAGVAYRPYIPTTFVPQIAPLPVSSSLPYSPQQPLTSLAEADLQRSSLDSIEMASCAPAFHAIRAARPCKKAKSKRSRDPDPEELKNKWMKIFMLQHLDGFWELTPELGELINLNVDVLANVFLKDKGIGSLGRKAHTDILKMVATLLVLQLMRVEKLEEGKLLQSLFRLEEAPQPWPVHWEQLKCAVTWVCWADQQYPCICSRLELGLSWESSTRQLLGFDSFPPYSSLIGLDLQSTASPLLVH